MRFTQIGVAGLLCLLSALGVAEDPETKLSSSVSSTAAGGDTDLRTLLREEGVKLHKHFVLHPKAPQTIDLSGLPHQDITYPQLLSVLALNGMVVVANDGISLVLPNVDARQLPLPLVAPDNIKTSDEELVTCVIPVKNISAAQLVPILRPLIPVWGHLAALPDRNALILVDRSGNVRRLVEIIKILESLPKAPEIAPPTKTP
jgi:general secretion pathway protein D